MTVSEFKNTRPLKSFISYSLADVICLVMITPYMSTWFINKKIIPNQITMMMVWSGFIFGILFLIPNLWLKLVCFGGYLLWFAFDCSDGEVARYTQEFSKFGKQLDWMAHLVCHPLFIIGMWISICDYYPIYDTTAFTIYTMFFLSVEIVHRNLVAFKSYDRDVLIDTVNPSSLANSILSNIKLQLTYFPNMVILGPLLLFVDIVTNLYLFPFVYIIWSFIYFIYVLKEFIHSIKIMYKS